MLCQLSYISVWGLRPHKLPFGQKRSNVFIWHGREDSNPELRFWTKSAYPGEGLSPLPLCGFPYTVKCAILDANVATLSRAMVRFRPISKSPVRVGSISIEMGVPLV